MDMLDFKFLENIVISKRFRHDFSDFFLNLPETADAKL